MGFWRKTGKVLGHAVDFRVDRWLDWEGLRKSSLYFWYHGKRLFKPKPPADPESFEEAVERLNLTSEALTTQKKRYQYLSFLFLAMAIAIFVYATFITTLGNWRGAILSFALAVYALSQAFRFHFWYFQITQKKLGCAPSEWLREFTLSSIKSIKRTKLQ